MKKMFLRGFFMSYLLMSLFALLIAGADQITKFLTVSAIELGGTKEFIPGLLRFTYVRNTGGAWSMLSDHTWLLIAVSVVFFALIITAMAKKYINRSWS